LKFPVGFRRPAALYGKDMNADRTLLSEYATQGAEGPFRELVARYINLVHSTAVRLVHGDTHQAEDIVQTVFADLARLAGTLSGNVMLGGWLHRRTCHVALSAMRRERRRQHRERQAAEMNAIENSPDAGFERMAPVLDEAINQLGAADRTAIMLRFFEGRDLRSIGAALGSNEDAAQKRVTRGLDKLRGLLGRRGMTTSATALAAALSVHAVVAAPAGLATAVSTAALAGAAAGGGATLTLLKLMAMTKLKIAVGAVVVAGVGTTWVLEHQALNRLREENRALEQQVARLSRPTADLPSRGPNAPSGPQTSLAERRLRDLDRLRGEVSALRRQTGDLASLQAENRQLRSATDEPDDPAEAEFREQTLERVNHLKQWGLSFILYANDHQDQYPTTFEQAAGVQHSESLLGFDTNHFEIVFTGTRDSVPDPGKTLIFREKQARRSPKGDWIKVYGFADGSVETHPEPDETSFAAWERDRVVRPR
jgi:RNA polymerase sigma factor (sigma-70 family)